VVEKHPVQAPPKDGTITVGIPCYNHARYLADSIGSVLAQTRQVDEIIVLNDGSTDDFKTQILQFTDPRIRVMAFDENRGIDEAANQMAFRAKGDFFVFLAADDMMHPQYIEKCLKEFATHPWTEMVASQTGFIDAEGKPFNTVENPMFKIKRAQNYGSREEWLAAMHPGNHYFGIGMYRTLVLSEVGGWEKQYKVISDYQLYLKLLQREAIRIVEEPLTITRVTGDNKSLLSGKEAQELPLLYHEARKPFYRKMMKVMIATPFYELKGFSPYIRTLCETLRLLTAVGIDYHFQELSGDSYVHRARNTLCDLFLRDPDLTDLFFIDSDMSWNPEAFVQMCMLPDDVVGAAYPVKNKWEAWTSIPRFHHANGETHLQGRNLGDGTALIEAQVLAGGFLRIKRAALEKFKAFYPDLWYEEPTTDPANPNHRYTQFFGAESIDHKFYGEDHMFSKHLRDAGIRMFIYPNVDIVHWGYKDFAGNFDRFLKKEKFEESAKRVLPQEKAA
jgi:glycosyltransferase involved in cell wall biosynthesis